MILLAPSCSCIPGACRQLPATSQPPPPPPPDGPDEAGCEDGHIKEVGLLGVQGAVLRLQQHLQKTKLQAVGPLCSSRQQRQQLQQSAVSSSQQAPVAPAVSSQQASAESAPAAASAAHAPGRELQPASSRAWVWLANACGAVHVVRCMGACWPPSLAAAAGAHRRRPALSHFHR